MSHAAIGYHASHEQFTPSELLAWVQRAEDRGFAGVLASDHFHPWSERQGESGHVWSWLGAAMASTSLPYGTVNTPGYRYHPAVIAQAAATLRSLFPDRFWLAVGSGQLLNEGITGTDWPIKSRRNDRLAECVSVMRQLWDGEQVTHHGEITVERATLHTRPEESPSLIGAALSVETAAWLGEWADGMITVGTPDQAADKKRIDAFRDRAPDKPVYLKVQLSYDEDDDAALEGAYEQWRTNCIPGSATQQFRTAQEYDELGELIDRETVKANVRVSADLGKQTDWLETDRDHGVDRIFLHNVNTEQAAFIDDFGEEVLPRFQ